MHRLVIIGSSIEFIHLVQLAGQRGYYTIVCDGYPDGPAKKYADKVYNINIRDDRAVAEMCRKEKADGIIGSFSDLIFEQITRIASAAGLRWYAVPGQLNYYREKNYTKKMLAELGIRVPKNTLLKEDFREEELDGFTFPLVIKPVNGYGSKGIFVVHDMRELREFLPKVNQLGTGTFSEVMAEEYSKGREFNMMSWLCDGKVYPLSIADREKNPQSGNDIPIDNRNVYPSKLTSRIEKEAAEVLQKFADRIGQKEGALSMQFFYNENGVEVCEIAGRLFGYEHELVTWCSGLDIEELMLDYVYEPANVLRKLEKHDIHFSRVNAVLYFFGRQGRTVADQSAAEALTAAEDIIQADFFYKNGEVIDNYGSKPYFLRLYIKAENREMLDRRTRQLFADLFVPDENGENLIIPPLLEED